LGREAAARLGGRAGAGGGWATGGGGLGLGGGGAAGSSRLGLRGGRASAHAQILPEGGHVGRLPADLRGMRLNTLVVVAAIGDQRANGVGRVWGPGGIGMRSRVRQD